MLRRKTGARKNRSEEKLTPCLTQNRGKEPEANSFDMSRTAATFHSKDQQVLAIGELLWDLLPSGKMLGGAPANCCFRLSQLGIHARMATRIGEDSLGEELASTLAQRGFDLSLVQRDPSLPTGTVDVLLSADGSPDFTINSGVAYDALEATADLLSAAAESALVCFGTLIQRTRAAQAVVLKLLEAAPQAIRFLDINLRKNCFSRDTISASFEHATIVKLNTGEVETVARLLGIRASTERGRVAELLQLFALECVLVTRGAHGVFALHRSGEEVDLPGISVVVADTVGSGDSFSAGFIAQRLADAPLATCCHFGNINGALNATLKGGMPQISPQVLEEFSAIHPLSLR